VWFTTQPIEEPVAPATQAAVLAQLQRLGLGDRLMFSSDYPHWDFDNPEAVLGRGLDPELRARILGATASELYGIPLA
jgi:predicted TIM-barrel fold metal-dependent hydrolase